MDADLERSLIVAGFIYPRELPDGRIIALQRFIFTVGLCIDVDHDSYASRYCYQTASEALTALLLWDGQGDPPGPWLKHKGSGIDRRNPAPDWNRLAGIPISEERKA